MENLGITSQSTPARARDVCIRIHTRHASSQDNISQEPKRHWHIRFCQAPYPLFMAPTAPSLNIQQQVLASSSLVLVG